MLKKTQSKRTQPKKCTQTICGNTCIKKGYTCHDDNPKTKVAIKQKGKELSLMLRKKKNHVKKTKQSPIGFAVSLSKFKLDQNTDLAKNLKKQAQNQLKELPKKKQRRSNQQGSKIVDDIQGKSKSKKAVDREVKAGFPFERESKTMRAKKGKDIFDQIRTEELAQRRKLVDVENDGVKSRKKKQNNLTGKPKKFNQIVKSPRTRKRRNDKASDEGN